MLRRLLQAVAWMLAAGVVFATLSPISQRPRITYDAPLERFLAFAILGYIFTLAFPSRRALSLAGLVGGAVALELAQRLVHTRHANPADAIQKSMGAVAGAVLAITPQRIDRTGS